MSLWVIKVTAVLIHSKNVHVNEFSITIVSIKAKETGKEMGLESCPQNR